MDGKTEENNTSIHHKYATIKWAMRLASVLSRVIMQKVGHIKRLSGFQTTPIIHHKQKSRLEAGSVLISLGHSVTRLKPGAILIITFFSKKLAPNHWSLIIVH